MNKCISNIRNKYNTSGEYTKLVTRIVLCFLLCSVTAYLYLSQSENFAHLLLSDDMAYALRSGFFVGVIGLWAVSLMERKIEV